MKRMAALLLSLALVAVACGSDDETTDTDPSTEGSGDTSGSGDDGQDTDPELDPDETGDPAPATNVIGLVPLPGAVFDFGGSMSNEPVVWSAYSGSGGTVTESLNGNLPPSCVGSTWFDAQTQTPLVASNGMSAQAYSATSPGACDGMPAAEGFVDTEAVKLNEPTAVVFDFGDGLPTEPSPNPFISAQLSGAGGDGLFLNNGRGDSEFINDLSDATHVAGAFNLFARDAQSGDWSIVDQPDAEPGPGCVGDSLCLNNGRFQVDVADGSGGQGFVMASGPRSGMFYFGDPYVTVLLRVLNGCSVNDHFWVFASAATDVEFSMTVTDTSTGETREYTNPLGSPSQAITDTAAFATCP